jgi:electron transport complex protein RnfC
MPCIRCTRCADACPVNLQPQELYWFSKSDNFEKARDYNLFDCIECGCCSYVCPSDIPLVQYYRYAKSEIIAANKAKEAADLARERNEFRLARIEREKLERAQKHAERAQATKTDAKKEDAATNEAVQAKSATPETSDKQAAIAAAVARAKAQKLALENSANGTNAVTPDAPAASSQTNESQEDLEKQKQAKQALIAAAIERAKAQKLAAAQAGLSPKNTENISPAVQAEINKTDELREKAQQTLAKDKE